MIVGADSSVSSSKRPRDRRRKTYRYLRMVKIFSHSNTLSQFNDFLAWVSDKWKHFIKVSFSVVQSSFQDIFLCISQF